MERLKRETVRASMEVRWRLSQMKLYAGSFLMVAALSLVIGCFSMMDYRGDDSLHMLGLVVGILTITYGLVFMPFLLYSFFCYRHLLKHFGAYSVYVVTLDRPHTSMGYRGCVYFTVSFTGEDGQNVTADTHPLFSDAIFSHFTLDEYANQRVRILYDREARHIYLIDKV